jgi:hypothetical protein
MGMEKAVDLVGGLGEVGGMMVHGLKVGVEAEEVGGHLNLTEEGLTEAGLTEAAGMISSVH